MNEPPTAALKRRPLVLRIVRDVVGWFDSGAVGARKAFSDQPVSYQIDWVRQLPFLALHLMVFGVIWVGWSPIAVAVALAGYVLRMFGLTAFYHRYFSHRSYKANRFWQFLFAVWGNTSVQKGPLWWASHHREHHRNSDQPADVHSPVQHGFWWSQIGWILAKSSRGTNLAVVRDLAKYPELRLLDRFHVVVPVLYAVGMWFLGAWLERVRPEWGTNAPQMLIWGFFVSTVILVHGTGTINSLAHVIGRRRFETNDQSRNHLGLALLTLGEGWHNNHHRFPTSARQGFRASDIDLTYYVLKGMEKLHIVSDLKEPPDHLKAVR
ncbi:MAG: acyl-CoA desaturase [Planctomycetota bacterium]